MCPLPPYYDFSTCLFHLGDVDVVASCFGADLENTQYIERIADGRSESRRMPLVYTHDYTAASCTTC